jgi:membrane associated rhomboid family serine protease
MLRLSPRIAGSSAGKVPLVTLALALASLVVLFVLQSKDASLEQQALAYYRDSGLAGVELPLYRSYLSRRNDEASAERLHRLVAVPPDSAAALRLVQSDPSFLEELHAGTLLPAGDPGYAQWQQRRLAFDALGQSTFAARYDLEPGHLLQSWRLLTQAFLHDNAGSLAGNLVVLLLFGPFVEAALGRLRFLACYLLAAALAGALQLALSDARVMGASGAIAATVGMTAALYGTQRVPVAYRFFSRAGTARVPPLGLLPIWFLDEAYQWSHAGPAAGASAALILGVHVAALCAGAALAWLLQARAPVPALGAPRPEAARRSQPGSELAMQARQAATNMEVQRATRLYRQLVDLEPERRDYLAAYLNVTLLGTDEDALRDAALRLLWNKQRKATDEMRRTFLQLTHDKVLKVLPIDEHLRLARRLVKFREDAAALRVIDALLRDENQRRTYGRQLADCLLGIFTAYSRHGLQRQAEQISTRLSTYFPTGSQIGGAKPAKRPPPTIVNMFRDTEGFATTQSAPPEPRRGPPTLPGARRS